MKNKILITVIFLLTTFAYANTVTTVQNQDTQTALTVSQQIDYRDCTKIFKLNQEKLFYTTINAISANNFTLKEIQTENGYLIFKAAGRDYLATISEIDINNSLLKITPCNNIYYFQKGIIVNMFKYIELNIK